MVEETPWINTIPPEILSSIFLHTRTIRRHKRILPFQVTLSQVCSHWRQVAISTPQLWSSITVFSNASLPCMQTWLKRSGVTPLDVRIDLHDADRRTRGQINPQWIDESLSSLFTRVQQFRTLLIFAFLDLNIYHLLNRFHEAKAPYLERLCVHVGGIHRVRLQDPPLLGFNIEPTIFKDGLPKLDFVESGIIHSLPPLQNISTLHLVGIWRESNLNFNKLVEILQTPNRLISFSLRGWIEDDSWPSNRNGLFINLPFLRNLQLSGMRTTGVRLLLAIDAPNLESLRWHVSTDNYHLLLDSPQFSDQLGKFHKLKFLTLERQSLDPLSLQPFMELFPTPTHVFFSYPIQQRRHKLSDVMHTSNATPGWPNLQVLGFKMVNARHSEEFAPEMRVVLPLRLNIKTLLVDLELLQFLEKTAPDLKGMVGMEVMTTDNFPDYWYTSREEEAPYRV